VVLRFHAGRSVRRAEEDESADFRITPVPLKPRKPCTVRDGTLPAASAAGDAPQTTVPVHMVGTVDPLQESNAVYAVSREDMKVKQGKKTLPVTAWTPARGDQPARAIYRDRRECNTSLGQHLADLKEFIKAQPSPTWIGLGYARNRTVNIIENLTGDHEKVAGSVGLPLGTVSAQDSIYLSLVDLMKRWPEIKQRRGPDRR
jgi:hypothetical protein